MQKKTASNDAVFFRIELERLSRKERESDCQSDLVRSAVAEAVRVIGLDARCQAAISEGDLDSNARPAVSAVVVATATTDADSQVDAVPNAVPARHQQQAKLKTVGGYRNPAAMNRVHVEARLELQLITDEIPKSEILGRQGNNGNVRIVEAECHAAVDAELDGATAAARSLCIGSRRGQRERNHTEDNNSFHLWKEDEVELDKQVNRSPSRASDDPFFEISQIR